MALHLKPTRRNALNQFQGRTAVFIHRRAVAGAGCMNGRNGSKGPFRRQREQSLAGHLCRAFDLLTRPPLPKVKFRGRADSRSTGRPRSGIGARRHSPANRDRPHAVWILDRS